MHVLPATAIRLVLALVSGGDIIGWPQVDAALIGIVILPDTPMPPSINDRCAYVLDAI
jgi:hypothetical protein